MNNMLLLAILRSTYPGKPVRVWVAGSPPPSPGPDRAGFWERKSGSWNGTRSGIADGVCLSVDEDGYHIRLDDGEEIFISHADITLGEARVEELFPGQKKLSGEVIE
jgi:hypothetical protein